MLPLLLTLAAAPSLDATHEWGQWRGPLHRGEAPHATPPTNWSEEENVRWKTELPGVGHSSPIVWGDLVIVTTAVPTGDPIQPRQSKMEGAHDNTPVTSTQAFQVVGVDRKTGEIAWTTTVRESIPSDTAHKSGGYASPSPVTDGEVIAAFFGSEGLYLLDLAGEVLWSKDLGDMQVKHSHGEGAGAALFGDTVCVNWDHEGDSFVACFDKKSGEERWRTERDEPTSWSTPVVHVVDGKPQLIVAGTNRSRGYDLATGKSIWECGGLSHNVVASPIIQDGLCVFTSSYEKQAMFAIELSGAKGDLTTGSDKLRWFRRRRTPYVPSPLLYQGIIYNVQHYQPVLCRTQVEDGDEGMGAMRVGAIGDMYASPVAADGRVYFTDMEGVTLVFEPSGVDEAPKAIARNVLDDRISASAALRGSEMFLRGERFLYCLAEEE